MFCSCFLFGMKLYMPKTCILHDLNTFWTCWTCWTWKTAIEHDRKKNAILQSIACSAWSGSVNMLWTYPNMLKHDWTWKYVFWTCRGCSIIIIKKHWTRSYMLTVDHDPVPWQSHWQDSSLTWRTQMSFTGSDSCELNAWAKLQHKIAVTHSQAHSVTDCDCGPLAVTVTVPGRWVTVSESLASVIDSDSSSQPDLEPEHLSSLLPGVGPAQIRASSLGSLEPQAQAWAFRPRGRGAELRPGSANPGLKSDSCRCTTKAHQCLQQKQLCNSAK